MTEFLQQLLNGVLLGAIYALIALGYTMVYGVLRFINFAHSDVFMLGAFVAWYSVEKLGLPTQSIVGGLAALMLSMSEFLHRSGRTRITPQPQRQGARPTLAEGPTHQQHEQRGHPQCLHGGLQDRAPTRRQDHPTDQAIEADPQGQSDGQTKGRQEHQSGHGRAQHRSQGVDREDPPH